MRHHILSLFPAHIHPLTLASDPDGLLGGEAMLFELNRRGFVLIQESDPVLLRRQVEQARPFTSQKPALVITAGELEALPYDLWQAGYRVRLSVHDYFPNLSYPIVRALNPDQLERLALCPQPAGTLGRRRTVEYLLSQLFDADPANLGQPHRLVAWLARYHQGQFPMPSILQEGLVERLRGYPEYGSWDLAGLIASADAFNRFIDSQWGVYIQRQAGRSVGESQAEYLLPFESDAQLQDMLPELVRKQVLAPVEVEPGQSLPNWARAAVVEAGSISGLAASLLEEMGTDLRSKAANTAEMSWLDWKQMAERWAKLNEIWQRADFQITEEQNQAFGELCGMLDSVFAGWLQAHYSPLGASRLPVPKHVFHVPHYLAYQRSLGALQKLAVVVLDGLSLCDWQSISGRWKKAHPAWNFRTELLLAQIPTITSISRHALISGLRPADYAGGLDRVQPEARAWEVFWSRQGLAGAACALKSIALDRDGVPPEIESHRLEAVCLVDHTLDEITHNAVLGAADQQASLRVWLDDRGEVSSKPLEDLVDRFLDRQFTVFIASDHGHVEARGFGQPAEGLLAQTRGKRARLYTDRRAALRVQEAFPETILWEGDGLLPEQLYTLVPARRNAFATEGDTVVTHGGLTVDEVVVPFIQIDKT